MNYYSETDFKFSDQSLNFINSFTDELLYDSSRTGSISLDGFRCVTCKPQWFVLWHKSGPRFEVEEFLNQHNLTIKRLHFYYNHSIAKRVDLSTEKRIRVIDGGKFVVGTSFVISLNQESTSVEWWDTDINDPRISHGGVTGFDPILSTEDPSALKIKLSYGKGSFIKTDIPHRFRVSNTNFMKILVISV
jgi:hypothetical protein